MKKVTIKFVVPAKERVTGRAHSGCCKQNGGCTKKHGN